MTSFMKEFEIIKYRDDLNNISSVRGFNTIQFKKYLPKKHSENVHDEKKANA